MSDKDYVVEIRVKNGPLLRKIREAGFKTVAEFARAAGVTGTQVGEFLNLKRPPITKRERISETVIKISNVLKCLPEDIFPEQHMRTPLEKNKAEFEVDIGQIGHFIQGGRTEAKGPEFLASLKEAPQIVEAALSTLPDRAVAVLRARFGFDGDPKSYWEIGEKLGIGAERVRQIELKALGKLGRKANEKPLRGALSVLSEAETN